MRIADQCLCMIHSNNGAMIWYTRLLVQYTHSYCLTHIETAKICFKLQTNGSNLTLQIISHFGLHRQTIM